MNGIDRQQLLGVLIYLAMAAFVGGGLVAARYRRRFTGAAIGGYAVALVLVLVWIALWLLGLDR